MLSGLELRARVGAHFGFLMTEFGFRLEEPRDDREGTTVSFMGPRVRVNVHLEDGGTAYGSSALYVDLQPLVNGVVPPRWDKQLHEQLTTFGLTTLIRLYQPNWQAPPKTEAIRTPEDIEEVLKQNADALHTYGRAALRGEPAVFAQTADAARAELIRVYTGEWETFVGDVVRGFTGGIGAYVAGVTLRGQLETFLERWPGDRSRDPRLRVRELDEQFFECTDPLELRMSGGWTLLPAPTARKWWRRPQVMGEDLSSYFMHRG